MLALTGKDFKLTITDAVRELEETTTEEVKGERKIVSREKISKKMVNKVVLKPWKSWSWKGTVT